MLPNENKQFMSFQQIKNNYLKMVIDSLKTAIMSLQISLLKSADKIDNLSPETAELKAMAFSLAFEINPIHQYLEQLKTNGPTPKALIFIDSDGKTVDLLSGKTLSGQDAIDQILDSAKI